MQDKHLETITIDKVELSLSSPDSLNFNWIGQEDVLKQLLASWLVIDESDIPLNPRLIGKPGVGKTTLAFAAAQMVTKRCLYLPSNDGH